MEKEILVVDFNSLKVGDYIAIKSCGWCNGKKHKTILLEKTQGSHMQPGYIIGEYQNNFRIAQVCEVTYIEEQSVKAKNIYLIIDEDFREVAEEKTKELATKE